MNTAVISKIGPDRVVVTIIGKAPPGLVLKVETFGGYVQNAELTYRAVLDSKTAPGAQR